MPWTMKATSCERAQPTICDIPRLRAMPRLYLKRQRVKYRTMGKVLLQRQRASCRHRRPFAAQQPGDQGLSVGLALSLAKPGHQIPRRTDRPRLPMIVTSRLPRRAMPTLRPCFWQAVTKGKRTVKNKATRIRLRLWSSRRIFCTILLYTCLASAGTLICVGKWRDLRLANIH